MEIEIKKSFAKDTKKLEKNLKKEILEFIEEVEKADKLDELQNVTKIKGYSNFYRIRFGNYRLGFHFEGETITLIRFLHRKDIYKYFP